MQLGQLPLEGFDAGGQGGKICGRLNLLIGLLLVVLVLLIPRGHGNYFTAITRGSGTEVRQLIVFALRKRVCRIGSWLWRMMN